MAFFEGKQAHFFLPLARTKREKVAHALEAIYHALYSCLLYTSLGVPVCRSRLNSPKPDSKMLCSPVPARPFVSMLRYKVDRSPPDQNAVSNFSACRRDVEITRLFLKMMAQEATEAPISKSMRCV